MFINQAQIICTLALLCIVHSQAQLTLIVPSGQADLVVNGQVNTSFVNVNSGYNCSSNNLFTYVQTEQQLINNTPYTLSVKGAPQLLTFSISSTYRIISPTITPLTCFGSCNLTIVNNCPNPVNFFNYFDIIELTVSSFQQPFVYDVLCNQQFTRNTFEWGLFIEIVICTMIIIIMAIYSKAWSFGGEGIDLNIYMVVSFNLALIIGGVIGAFSEDALNIILYILAFVVGICGVAICANETLFLFRLKMLKKVLLQTQLLKFRVLQLVSLLIGTAVTLGWWFSNKNWIVNDIVSVCMIVACIKILKFTSLQMAVICFLITMTVQMTFVITIHFTVDTTYNILFLNNFNNPFELQLPTINPVFQQKCAWLPVTAIIYPGMLMSYVRRFDTSFNTNVYLITCAFLFLSGSIAWMFISIFNPYIFPLGLTSQPLMIILMCLFAYKRREIRTLWEGKFYDVEFKHRADLNLTQLAARQNSTGVVSLRESLAQGLRYSPEEQSRRDSEMKNIGKGN